MRQTQNHSFERLYTININKKALSNREKAFLYSNLICRHIPLDLAPLYLMYRLPDFIGPVPSIALDKNLYLVLNTISRPLSPFGFGRIFLRKMNLKNPF